MHEFENYISRKKRKIRPTQNTPRNPQQPGNRNQLETACDETRPTRYPILARFHRSRVCGNRPRTALEINKNDECYIYRQTDYLSNGTLYAPRYRYEEAFKGKKRPRMLRSLGLASLLSRIKHGNRGIFYRIIRLLVWSINFSKNNETPDFS